MSAHEKVALCILSYLSNILARVFGQNLIEQIPNLKYLPGVDIYVRGLALGTT